MQTTNQLTANLAEKLQTSTNSGCSESLTKSLESKYSPTAIQTATARVLNLFAEFKEEYGALFDNKEHRYTPAKAREWAVELLESGINGEQYQRGRWQALKQQDYPVERAYKFIKLCKQGEIDTYPSATEAFDNACSQSGLIEDKYVKRQWLHDVVQLTAHRVGMGRLKTADNKFLGYFSKVYEQVCSEHEAGTLSLVPVERQIAHSHHPVQAGSEVDKKISEQLAQLRRVAV